MMKRRSYDEDLKDIPSLRMSEEDVEDYHRATSNLSIYDDEPQQVSTLPIWIVLTALIGVVLVGGYFIADMRYQLNASHAQLEAAATQIDSLATVDKKVSSTGSALQDQLKQLKSDVKKMQDQLSKLQQDYKTALESQSKAMDAVTKKMTDITTALDENKVALATAQEALKKGQPAAADAAQLKALESKVNELSLDVMAKAEQAGGTATTADAQKLVKIDEQIKSIDTFRQSVNARIDKMQNDINKLYIDVEALN